jgi:hypothetical protein
VPPNDGRRDSAEVSSTAGPATRVWAAQRRAVLNHLASNIAGPGTSHTGDLNDDRRRAWVTRGLGAFLEPGERVHYAFRATAGPRRAIWLGPTPSNGSAVLFAPVLLAAARALKVMNLVVAVTDRAIVVVRTSQFGEHPREVVARLPRQTQLGPFEGRGWITLGGMRMWVRDVPDLLEVQDADHAVGFETGPPEYRWP